jgi:hypothetical protein
VKMVVPTRGSLLEGIRAADTDGDARSFKIILRGESRDLRDGKLYFRGSVPTSNMMRIDDSALDPLFRSARTHDGWLPEPDRPTP